MIAPRNIVVGLDLDPKTCAVTSGSLAAAETALWLGRRAGAAITLVHSLARSEYFDPLLDELVPVCDTVEPNARLAVSELVARLRGADLGCETVDSSERPSVAIAREVARQGAELVLLGKHDGHESDASRIGPVAMRVLRESTAPVWIVVPGRPVIPRRVVAATDFSKSGAEAVATAGSIARLAQAELHVVHIHPPALHSRRADSESHLQRLRELAVKPLPATERAAAHVHLREAAPAQGVLTLIEDLDADLVVLGAYSHPAAAARTFGSTAERVLAHVEVAALIVRPSS